MTDTFKTLTVSELTAGIKEVLEGVFYQVSVEGELSNVRRPSSGHLYFTLKDEACALRCVMFRSALTRLGHSLQDGMKVICRGRVGVYEKSGQYQLYVEGIEPQGVGSLQMAFEKLKDRLAKEGLFDLSHKRPLPYLPERIGVITSPTGAVIRDILHVLQRRFPGVHVVIYPVRVQGDGSKEEIVEALESFNDAAMRVDVIILARGGGSLEDLRPFNEEDVARAIYCSKVPVISGIGHQTDYTIADFAADQRAPTPSAAAEVVVPTRFEITEKVENLLRYLWRSFTDVVPERLQRIDEMMESLNLLVSHKFETCQARLLSLQRQLESLDPEGVLKRGYSLTTCMETGEIIYSSKHLKKGGRVLTKLSQGAFESEVVEVKTGNSG